MTAWLLVYWDNFLKTKTRGKLFPSSADHRMAVEQHLQRIADCWVTHRTTGAAAPQTDRGDKNSRTCRIDPSLSEGAVAHPLRQPLGMHTRFQVKDKWKRWQPRARLTEEMWRSDMLLWLQPGRQSAALFRQGFFFLFFLPPRNLFVFSFRALSSNVSSEKSMIWIRLTGEECSGQGRQSSAKSVHLEQEETASEGFQQAPAGSQVQTGEPWLRKAEQTLKDGAKFCCRGCFFFVVFF